MQNYSQTFSQDIRPILDGSQEILVLFGKNTTFDSVAAALSLYLSLSGTGKRVSVASPNPMTVEFNRLVGVDKVSQNISSGGRNLIVSFPYVEGSIEKVSYNIENDTFNLVIEPREGYPTITQDKLLYSFGGGTFDVIFTVGVADLADLDSLYFQNQNLFSQKPIINIDINGQNTRYGKVNTILENYSSVSELMVNILNSLNLRIDGDIATNLLAGISFATNNFMSPTSGVSAFETAAILMRNGARRMDMGQPYQFPTQAPYQPQPMSVQPQYQQQQYTPPLRQPMQPAPAMRPQPQMQPPPQKLPLRPTPQPQPAPNKQQKKQEAPPDWLKPKIYKGSTLL